MRTRLKALSALAISSLLITATAAVVSAEGTMEACYQQKVGNLRKATDILPCKSTSENSVILQIGEPAPPTGGGGLSGYEIVSETFSYAAPQSDDFYTESVSCPAGKVATGYGERKDRHPVYTYSISTINQWPVSPSKWNFTVAYFGEGTALDITLYLICVDA